jgi:tRNA modification GTPase
MHSDLSATICALATPPGTGGIAIIRVSGPETFAIVNKHLNSNLLEKPSHTIHYGIFRIDDQPLDTVTLFLYRAPHSYTGQDIIEIGCHGGPLLVDAILQGLCNSGCKPAGPGEFTLRAFLNGKLDLTQAEAIHDLIHASSPNSMQSSSRQLIGSFRQEIEDLRSKTESLFKHMILEFDFAHEGIVLISPADLLIQIDSLLSKANHFLNSYESAHLLRSGHQVLFLGYPNAGKSSLFNSILGYTRSIVSEKPGTTRDFVESTLLLKGINYTFIDTAGIRENTEDTIEETGISYSLELIARATILIIINDSSLGLHASDPLIIKALQLNPKAIIHLVQNKCDLLQSSPSNNSPAYPFELNGSVIHVSALHNQGIDSILEALANSTRKFDQSIPYLLNKRQFHLLQEFQFSLQNARNLIEQGYSGDMIAVDLRSALDALSHITGSIYTEDLLNDVFGSFCIGK